MNMESRVFRLLIILLGTDLLLIEGRLDLTYPGILERVESLSHEINNEERENLWTRLTQPDQFQPTLDLDVAGKLGSAPPKTYNVSTRCMDDFVTYVSALLSGKQWALQMLDAVGKPHSGILQGNIIWLGGYAQCLQISPPGFAPPNSSSTALKSPRPAFETQYCVAVIGNASQPVGAMGMGSTDLQLGLCVPDSCSSEDTRQLVNTGLFFLPNETEAVSTHCVKETRPLSTSAIAFIVVLCIIGTFLLVGTVYDLLIHQPHLAGISRGKDKGQDVHVVNPSHPQSDPVLRVEEHTPLLHHQSEPVALANVVQSDKAKQQYSKGVQILLALSVYSNGAKILNTDQTSGTLQAVHGIRFISMTWVILGHAYFFGVSVYSNPLYLFGLLQKTTFQAIANATVSVDTFFMLSGLLAVYVLCRELDKKDGPRNVNWALVYFHRYWRLTPPYMLLLGLYTTLTVYFANGPLWPEGTMDPNCPKYWWANMLYINNLIDMKNMCLGWSWYLSNDMQFFLITPLLIVPLYLWYKIGVALIMFIMLVSFIVTGVIVSVNNYPAAIASALTGANVMGWFDDVYMKPWCRISPYLVGMLVGYALYRTKCKPKLHWAVVVIGWMVATATALSVLYGLSDNAKGTPLSTSVSALYNALNRAAWSAAVGWVCFACSCGYGGPVNTFLSWRPLVPLSRLTYMAYLIHPMVMTWFYLSRPETTLLDEYNIVYYFLGHTVISYGLAFMASLAFESPMMGLEKVLFPRT